MDDDKKEKDRQQEKNGFFGTAQVEIKEKKKQAELTRQFDPVDRAWQEAEDLIARAGHRNGDGKHVIDDQGRTRRQPSFRAEKLGSNNVATASCRKKVDNLAVACGDHENRYRHQECQGQS